MFLKNRLPMALALPQRRGAMPFRALRWHSPARVLLSSAETKDKALNIETAGEDYYRRLAEKAPEPVAKIFRELASDDREHQFTVDEAFRAGAKAMPALHESHIVETVDGICKNINRVEAQAEGKSMVEVYKAARDMEAKNRDQYLALAEKETDPDTRKLLEFLAQETDRHHKALDEMVHFVCVTDVWFRGVTSYVDLW